MIRKSFITILGATALVILPFSDHSVFQSGEFSSISSAYAKGGNGGGNGGGNDNAGGNSNAAGSGSAKSNGNGAKSLGGKGNSSAGKSAKTQKSAVGLRDKIFKRASVDKPKVSKRPTQLFKSFIARTVKQAAVKRVKPTNVPVPKPSPIVKDKNFHAKLAGLNSLKRNYHAYMNSNDPRMVSMREYIGANIAYEDAFAAATIANGLLADAVAGFAVLTDAIVAYDNFDYQNATLDDLAARQSELANIESTNLSVDDAATLAMEIESLNTALASEEATTLAEATVAADEAESAAEDLQAAAGDDALKEALLSAANPNRVAEYGEEGYVDQEMLDWAKDLLGVDEAYGKIDEIREASAVTETVEVETVEVENPVIQQ